jgi:predicted enzyme related to lactoylglutathione lyase
MRVRGYAAGMPCWAEVASPDPAVAATFYHRLFGWTLDDGRFSLDGRVVAGLRARTTGPVAWLISVAIDDAVATARAAVAAGGAVKMPPTAIGDDGTSVVVADASGAVLAGWQHNRFAGAQVFFEPGAACWYELATTNLSAASRFYDQVFDWQASQTPAVVGDPYFEFHHRGDSVAGLLPIDHRFPAPDVPPHWTVCFMVDDCTVGCDRVVELGGSVARKPMQVPAGWYARVADPYGAHFAIVEVT